MSRYTSVTNKTAAFGLQTPASNEIVQQYVEGPNTTVFTFSEHKPAVPAELELRRSLPSTGNAKANMRSETRVRKGFARADLSVGIGAIRIEVSAPSDMPVADFDKMVARAIGAVSSDFFEPLVRTGAI